MNRSPEEGRHYSLSARRRVQALRLTIPERIIDGGLKEGVDPGIAGSVSPEGLSPATKYPNPGNSDDSEDGANAEHSDNPGEEDYFGLQKAASSAFDWYKDGPLTGRPPRTPIVIGPCLKKAKKEYREEQEAKRRGEQPVSGANVPMKAAEELAFGQQPISGRKSSPSLIIKGMANRAKNPESNFVQTQLSLGQPVFINCQTCGLTYNLSKEKNWHLEHHDNYVLGVSIKKLQPKEKKLWSSIDQTGQESYIVVVDSDSGHHWQELAEDVLYNHVDPDLGAAEIPSDSLWGSTPDPRYERSPLNSVNSDVPTVFRYKVFLYVKASRVVGFLLAERIARGEGYRHKLKELKSESRSNADVATTTSKVATNKSYTCFMGVSKILVHEKHRQHGFALQLIRVARHDNFLSRQLIQRQEIAFTCPTDIGEKLAKSFQGSPEFDWLEYHPREDRTSLVLF